MTTTLDEVVSSLKSAGYIVNITPQEKQMMHSKEIVVLLDSVDVDVETNTTYMVTPKIIIRWNDTSINNIISAIAKIMDKVETSVTSSRPFKFYSPKITQLGAMYLIDLGFQYTDVVEVNT